MSKEIKKKKLLRNIKVLEA